MKNSETNLSFWKLMGLIVLLLQMTAAGLAQSVPPLINYQGKLTDQTGAPLPGGSYAIQFRLWDSPTLSGTNDLIWDQQQMVTLRASGVFNVILGAPGGSPITNTLPAVNNLAYAFAGSNCFLGLTVVVSNGVPLTSSGEIIPRQQLLSVPYAVSSAVAASVLPGSITTASLTPGLIQSTNLAIGSVTIADLAPRQTLTNSVGAGGVAVSLSTVFSTTSFQYTIVPNLAVTITTTGRPVHLMLVPDTISTNPASGYIGVANGGALPNLACYISILADQTRTLGEQFFSNGNANSEDYQGWIYYPVSSFQCVDFAAAPGQHTYVVQVKNVSVSFGVNQVYINGARLVAYEF